LNSSIQHNRPAAAAAAAAAVAAAGGSGLDPTNFRKTGGITADGMFRIRMGVAGATACFHCTFQQLVVSLAGMERCMAACLQWFTLGCCVLLCLLSA
jgi:hypothetical protein